MDELIHAHPRSRSVKFDELKWYFYKMFSHLPYTIYEPMQ